MTEVLQTTTEPAALVVLLVDGHADTRELYRAALEADGFSVVAHESAMAAVRSAETIQPAVIVTELSLPEMSGVVLCRTLKSLPGLTNTPVIAVAKAPR